MLLGLILLFLGMSCIAAASYKIGQVQSAYETNPTEDVQHQYNTSIVVVAVAFATILSAVLMVATNWNPLGSLGEYTIQGQQTQKSPLADLL